MYYRGQGRGEKESLGGGNGRERGEWRELSEHLVLTSQRRNCLYTGQAVRRAAHLTGGLTFLVHCSRVVGGVRTAAEIWSRSVRLGEERLRANDGVAETIHACSTRPAMAV